MAGVKGADKLRKLARDLRAAADRDLSRKLRAGISRTVKPFGEAVKAETATLPSGYAPVLGRALRVRASTRTRGAGAGVRIVVSAKGKVEDRDVAAVNAGALRHPLFGRRRRWYTTAVTPGFVDRPVERLGDDVRREVEKVVDDIADQIERG